MEGRLQPPGGMPPPTEVRSPHARTIDLAATAERTCREYAAEYPDERERYGAAGMDWCRHDIQHLLNWAVLSLTADVDFPRQLAWLGRVLESREFPLPRLARGLELLAGAVAVEYPDEEEVRRRVEEGAAFVREHPTFL